MKTVANIVDAIRFHEAALNALFVEAAEAGLEVRPKELPVFGYGFRSIDVDGDDWKADEAPKVEALRIGFSIQKVL